jgi:hypothetical protein
MQAEEELSKQMEQYGPKEEAYKLRKQVMDLLPDADANIAKLKEMIDANAGRLMELAAKWEERRCGVAGDRRCMHDAYVLCAFGAVHRSSRGFGMPDPRCRRNW